MLPSELAHLFAAVGNDDMASLLPAVEGLYDLVSGQKNLKLLELAIELARQNNASALRAFDAAMDMLTVESMSRQHESMPTWKAYALASVVVQPAHASLLRLANAEVLEADLAQACGIPAGHIKIVPLHLPTDAAFSMNPSEACHYCRKVKACAELLETDAGSGNSLEEVMQALDIDRFGPEVNECAPAEPVRTDAVILVLHRDGDNHAAEHARMSQVFSGGTYSFDGEYDLPEGRIAHANHTVVALGAPWSLFRSALHIGQAVSLSACLRSAADEAGVPVSELAVYIARVETTGTDSYTTRAAAVHPKAGLIAGVVEYEPSEPDQYVLACRNLLEGMGISTVKFLPGAHESARVDRNGESLMLLPGQGWQIAARTFTPHVQPRG